MCVRFYVLNHSKYRFLFNAVYIGIMNGIRKPTFHAARYNRQKYLDSDVRSRPLQSVRRTFFHLQTVVILHREQPYPRKQHRGILKTLGRDSPARIFPIVRWDHLHVVSLRKDLHEYDRSYPYCGFVTRLQTRKSN